jgi:hypothetical protein
MNAVQYMPDKARLLGDRRLQLISLLVPAFRQASKHNHRRQ